MSTNGDTSGHASDDNREEEGEGSVLSKDEDDDDAPQHANVRVTKFLNFDVNGKLNRSTYVKAIDRSDEPSHEERSDEYYCC